MKKIKIAKLLEYAKSRPPGYYEDVVSFGEIEGEYLLLARDDYLSLVAKYARPKTADEKLRIMGICVSCPTQHWNGHKCAHLNCKCPADDTRLNPSEYWNRCPDGHW